MEKRQSAFASVHPLVAFLFYTFVIVYTIFLSHPVYVGASFFLALAGAILVRGKGVLKILLFLLPMMLLILILNPLLNHYGTVPPLFYVGENPVTKEAVCYGAVSAFMLAAVLLWFVSCNDVLTSDKFIYLFGRIIPKVALILSMALRLIPKMGRQIKIIANAQNMIGKGLKGGGLFRKVKHGIRIISILITWSLENGIETSDSMRARGYGARHRTAFTLYRFYAGDRGLLTVLLLAAAFCIVGTVFGAGFFQYRALEFRPWTPWDISVFTVFTLVLLLPVLIEMKGRILWRYSISKI